MRKIKIITILCLIALLLTGCLGNNGNNKDTVKKSNSEFKPLCDKVAKYKKEYNDGNLTYEQVVSKLKSDSKSICEKKSDHQICKEISHLEDQFEGNVKSKYKIEDCSKYNDQEGKTMKDLCIASNNLVQEMYDKIPEVQSAEITSLDMSCQLELEK